MPNIRISSQFFAEMVAMHRMAKIAIMVAVDLLALPFCILIAILLRVGDLSLASHYGPRSYFPVDGVTVAAFPQSGLYRAVLRVIDQRMLAVTGLTLWLAVICDWFIVFSYVVASRMIPLEMATKVMRLPMKPILSSDCAREAAAIVLRAAGIALPKSEPATTAP